MAVWGRHEKQGKVMNCGGGGSCGTCVVEVSYPLAYLHAWNSVFKVKHYCICKLHAAYMEILMFCIVVKILNIQN